MFVIQSLLVALAVAVAIPTIYILVIVLSACVFRRKTTPDAPPLRLTVVVPAHNEDKQIAATVRSLLETDYPDEARQIVVIADNCDDNTATEARQAGAKAIERTAPDERGKGQALNWLFTHHADLWQESDGIVIVDADTLVCPAFLRELSASLAHPAVSAVQGFYGVANPTDSWRTALSAAALAVFHHIRPAGRNAIGGSAGFKGNGLALTTELVKKYGWPAFSIVEDIEFSLILLLDDIPVHYNPAAEVYGEMATTGRQASSQRMRWEGGRLALLKQYLPALAKAFLHTGKIAYLDGIFELMVPPLSLLVGAQLAVGITAACLCPWGAWWLLACLATMSAYVASGLLLHREPPIVWLSLLTAPLFVAWKIPLYAIMAVKGPAKHWHRTQRKTELPETPDEAPSEDANESTAQDQSTRV